MLSGSAQIWMSGVSFSWDWSSQTNQPKHDSMDYFDTVQAELLEWSQTPSLPNEKVANGKANSMEGLLCLKWLWVAEPHSMTDPHLLRPQVVSHPGPTQKCKHPLVHLTQHLTVTVRSFATDDQSATDLATVKFIHQAIYDLLPFHCFPLATISRAIYHGVKGITGKKMGFNAIPFQLSWSSRGTFLAFQSCRPRYVHCSRWCPGPLTSSRYCELNQILQERTQIPACGIAVSLTTVYVCDKLEKNFQ